jgi:hypothetical protein
MHEISTDAANWTDCGGESTGLAAGTYYVRVKGAGTVLASDMQTLTITAYVAPFTPDDSEPDLITELKSGATLTLAELERLIRAGKTLTVDAADGTKVELSTDTLKEIAEQSSGLIRFDFEKETTENDTKTAYDLTVGSGGKTIGFDGEAGIIPADSAYVSTAPVRTASIKAPDGSRRFVVSSEPFPYTDIPVSSYFYEAVNWADLLGITEGVGEGKFDPLGDCTRGQMVTFLWRAAGKPEPQTAECPFTDIDANAYYYKAILWAYENGITDGVNGSSFDPEGTVGRGQSVTFLCRALGGKAEGSTPFEDVAEGLYYSDAVSWAYENGVTDGTSATSFSPDDDCLRCQIVTFLYRAYAK